MDLTDTDYNEIRSKIEQIYLPPTSYITTTHLSMYTYSMFRVHIQYTLSSTDGIYNLVELGWMLRYCF